MGNEITPVIKGIIAAVPYAGGAVTWWNEREQNKINERLLDFSHWAEEEIAQLKAGGEVDLDSTFVQSEEFQRIIHQLISCYLSEIGDEKKSNYRSVFHNVMKNWRPSDAIREQYLALLSSTTDIEIRLLSLIYNKQNGIPEEGLQVLFEKQLPKESTISINELSGMLSLSQSEVFNISWGLAGKGLLFQNTGDLSHESKTVLTPMGLSFSRFVCD